MKKLLIICISLLLISCGADDKNIKNNKQIQSEQAVQSEEKNLNSEVRENDQNSGWYYDSSKNELKNDTLYGAGLTSNNTVQFNKPYDGGSDLTIVLQHNKEEGSKAIFIISNGKFSCDHKNCKASVKFDDGEMQQINIDILNYRSDLVFASDYESLAYFITQIKKSKKLIMEIDFYKEGLRQFIFDTEGLKWEHSQFL